MMKLATISISYRVKFNSQLILLQSFITAVEKARGRSTKARGVHSNFRRRRWE